MMRTKNVKPYAYGSLYKLGYPEEKIIPLISGDLINFTVAGPFQNTRPYLYSNTIGIAKSGVYQLTAHVSVLLNIDQTAVFNINLCADGSAPLIGSVFDATGISTCTGITVQSFLNVGDEVGLFIAETSEASSKPAPSKP